MKCLVTGCAGFIGSTISDQLLAAGHDVIGIDCLTDYYAPSIKMANISGALQNSRFEFLREDILSRTSFPEVDIVFHLAARAGVRTSWGPDFTQYSRNNINVTQHLLEYYKNRSLKKFVYASSSSVYGDVPLPMHEDLRPQPVSPYGVTKLAGEHLCYLYWKNYGLPTISLRYFSVYGPRQRPDMAIYKFIQAIRNDNPISIYGDGSQIRDFTNVSDIVDANLKAAVSDIEGSVINIGGGSRIPINDLISIIEEFSGKTAQIRHIQCQSGDVSDTLAEISKAHQELHWIPRVTIREGIRKYIHWYDDHSG